MQQSLLFIKVGALGGTRISRKLVAMVDSPESFMLRTTPIYSPRIWYTNVHHFEIFLQNTLWSSNAFVTHPSLLSSLILLAFWRIAYERLWHQRGSSSRTRCGSPKYFQISNPSCLNWGFYSLNQLSALWDKRDGEGDSHDCLVHNISTRA